MGTPIGDVFVETREKMASADQRSLSQVFSAAFNWREGDLLEYLEEHRWKPFRILGVRSCYKNAGDGWTAICIVARLTVGGHVSTNRGATLCRDKNGQRVMIKTLGARRFPVRRVGSSG